VLSLARHFYLVKNDGYDLFSSVQVNLVTLIKGYGVRQINTENRARAIPRITVEFSCFSCEKTNGTEPSAEPRVVVQTEQQHPSLLPYLAKCAASPACVIWEYSDYNLRWQSSIAHSVLLLPHMIQNRLDKRIKTQVGALVPLPERPLDVVFFGTMTPHRRAVSAAFDRTRYTVRFGKTQTAPVTRAGTVVWGSAAGNAAELRDMDYRAAKVCLVMHRDAEARAGEFHRLSELAKFGCVPVVERFGDAQMVDALARCAGVVQAELGDLVGAVGRVLKRPRQFASMPLRVKWWEEGINWRQLLNMSLGPPVTFQLAEADRRRQERSAEATRDAYELWRRKYRRSRLKDRIHTSSLFNWYAPGRVDARRGSARRRSVMQSQAALKHAEAESLRASLETPYDH